MPAPIAMGVGSLGDPPATSGSAGLDGLGAGAEAAATSSDGLAAGEGEPTPDVTFGVTLGAAVAAGLGLNVAMMFAALVGLKWQVAPWPWHGPVDQPPNTDPLTGCAVSVSGWPEANSSEQAEPHEIPAGLLVIEPWPEPVAATDTAIGLVKTKETG